MLFLFGSLAAHEDTGANAQESNGGTYDDANQECVGSFSGTLQDVGLARFSGFATAESTCASCSLQVFGHLLLHVLVLIFRLLFGFLTFFAVLIFFTGFLILPSVLISFRFLLLDFRLSLISVVSTLLLGCCIVIFLSEFA